MSPTSTKLITPSELTKEGIADLYFLSIGNIDTRKMHTTLLGKRDGPTPVQPVIHDVELDFKCWYSGLLSLANAIDPGVDLPPPQEMNGYIVQNFERAKTAIAA